MIWLITEVAFSKKGPTDLVATVGTKSSTLACFAHTIYPSLSLEPERQVIEEYTQRPMKNRGVLISYWMVGSHVLAS
jgi:hypothetical protein